MMNFRSSIKNISLFLISIFISQIASAQTFVPDEALAAVKTNGKWGYIDKTGKLVIPARFESAGVFTEGKAPVKIGMFWGFLDKKGKWAMKPVFTSASNFSNKKALVTVYDNHDSAAVTGYISTVGMLLYELQDYEIGYDYHDQLVRIRSSDNQGLAFGFRDSLGKYVIEPRFDAAMDFSEGMAAIMLGTKWGFTNLNNDYVVVPNYDEAFSFHDGVAYVRAGNKKGYINKKGKMVMNLSSYEEVSPFMYDEMVGVIKNGKAGFVNKKGKLVIKTQYDNPLPGAFNDSLAAVAVKGIDGVLKWGYINKLGVMVIQPVYEDASTFYEGFARIKLNGKYGFIDKTGKIIAEPIYEEAYDFTVTY